jgi:hypothetical protein
MIAAIGFSVIGAFTLGLFVGLDKSGELKGGNKNA